jgi:hypothetical protein
LNSGCGIGDATQEQDGATSSIAYSKEEWVIGSHDWNRLRGYHGHGRIHSNRGRGRRFRPILVNLDKGFVEHI